ncbi:hypothetical protein EA462_04650 [Natrarchaeobius halalkaliphilus]|uniref:MarR family transcriptional regulator n=1 Tax=Natrarchaeobius halalkaliphilus TaxID=1679091 RepID=A0A3N6M7G2_9EURY|nr:hypothetical protein [Natrarchaeobius halalkaliphilus]RQG91281.1 hypothetical protein EA462_04650 [Natrarchaeobius halalkaliphilus]
MARDGPFDSISLTDQLVLLGIVELHRSEGAPVQTPELRRVCDGRLVDANAELVGTLTEADVMRSLYRLEDEGFVTEIDDGGGSPTGKGRPAYELAHRPEAVDVRLDDRLTADGK